MLHFSTDHICMVMVLCSGIHFHLCISNHPIIFPFLSPKKKWKNPYLICAIRRDRFLSLIPHFSPTTFPPEMEKKEAERDAALQRASSLTCPDGDACVLFLIHSIYCSEPPSVQRATVILIANGRKCIWIQINQEKKIMTGILYFSDFEKTSTSEWEPCPK